MVTPNIHNTKVRFKYHYDFIKMSKPHVGKKDQPFAQRLADYMNKYGLTIHRFAELCQEYSSQYGTKVTPMDIQHYLYQGVSPKIDKLYAISKVMGVSIDYFCGYGSRNRRTTNPRVVAELRKKVN